MIVERYCANCGRLCVYDLKNAVDRYEHKKRLENYTKCNKCSQLKFHVNNNFLDVIEPVQAWFLGLMASDGCVISDNALSLSQSHSHGRELLQKIKDLLEFEGNITKYKNSFRIHITSRKLVKKLSEYNIVNRKSLIYQYPEALDKTLFKYFLRGYFDGDGSIGAYRKSSAKDHHQSMLVASFVGTHKFIDRCAELIPFNKASFMSKPNVKEFRFNGWKAVEFCEWLYKPSIEDIPIYYKEEIYKNYKIEYPITEFHHYLALEEEAKNLFLASDGTFKSVKDIASTLNVNWRQVYTWKSRNFVNPTYKEFIRDVF